MTATKQFSTKLPYEHECSLVLIKPRLKTTEETIILLAKTRGLKIYARRVCKMTKNGKLASKFYNTPNLSSEVVSYLSENELVTLVFNGPDAIKIMRDIRAKLLESENLAEPFDGIHASDSPEEAIREMGVLFSDLPCLRFPSPITSS